MQKLSSEMSKATLQEFVKKVCKQIKCWRKKTLLEKRAESLETNRPKEECNRKFRSKVRAFRANNDEGYQTSSSTMHTDDFQSTGDGTSSSDDETTEGGRQKEKQSVEIYVNKS